MRLRPATTEARDHGPTLTLARRAFLQSHSMAPGFSPGGDCRTLLSTHQEQIHS